MPSETEGRDPRSGASGTRRDFEVEPQLLLEAVFDLVYVIGRDDTVRYANPAALRALGRTGEEVIDRPRASLFPPPVASQQARSLEQVFQTGQPLFKQEELKSNDSVQWQETQLIPLKNPLGEVVSVLGISRDITERKKLEKELRAREETYRSVVDNIGIGIAVISPQMEVLSLNPKMREWFPRVDATQRHLCYRVFNDPPRETVCSYCPTRKTLQDGQIHEAITETPYEGAIVNYRLIASPVKDPEGRVVGAIEMVENITERRQAEEQFLAMEKQIQMLHTQRLESLGVLAGGIAHDFNNLLSVVTGNLSIAREEIASGLDPQPYLDGIEQAARRAADLTQQMLAYAGKGKVVVETIDLSRIIREMGALLRTSVSKKAVLRLQVAPDLPLVRADASQINQVLLNLILNASDALGDQPGEISVTLAAEELDGSRLKILFPDRIVPEGVYVIVEVKDTGCGMDASTRARIFDPFFSTKFIGRGLGLSAVLGIVHGHKGEIRVESEPGQGSTFAIYLPACKASLVAPDPLPPAEQPLQFQGTVLIVEDEEMIRKLQRIMLEKVGFRVIEAHDGQEALRIYQEHQQEIGLVLLDYKMPHMDGVETFIELRKIYPEVVAILSSGYTEENAVDEYGHLGWAGFIKKPFDIQSLKASIVKILLSRKGR